MDIKLIKLTLKNFKGVESFSLEPVGDHIDVFGDNETGKSTLADAFFYLLFDKDSNGAATFGIKTVSKTDVDHAVSGIFEIDGKRLTLKKIYREKWTKKRGSASAEFTGHETLYYLDGDKVTKRFYEDRIKEIIDAETFRLLTDPRYLPGLHWEKRRAIITGIFGDISDADVISADKSLTDIPEIIGDKTAEQVKKNLKSRQTEINKDLKEIPARIDELSNSLPEAADFKKLNHALADIQQSIIMLSDEKQQLENSDGQAQLKADISTKAAELKSILTEHDSNVRELVSDLRIKKNESVRALYDCEKKKKEADQNRSAELIKIDRIKKEIAEKLAEWHEENANKFEYEADENCPTCGQPLPPDRVHEATKKALEIFNTNKARILDNINKEGLELREEESKLSELVMGYEKTIFECEADAGQLQENIASLDNQIIEAEKTPVPAAYVDKEKELDSLVAKLEAHEKPDTSKIDSQLSELREKETEINRATAAQVQRINGEKRLAELKGRERELSAEYEDIERQVVAIESFSLKKAILIQDRVNSAFTLASFKMFNEQINGGIDDCCTVTDKKGVEWPDMSNSQQIRVGLDIINVLSDHYGITCPIWIDNAEASTWFVDTKAQTIRLNVSEPDKELRVEPAKKSKAA